MILIVVMVVMVVMVVIVVIEFWFSWRNQLREFCNDYFVVAVDQRGYSDSDKPKRIEDYTIDKLSNDMKELILGLDKENIILVGHDW
jgi:pimeloyl-ACP methyl ester carboxylesterase